MNWLLITLAIIVLLGLVTLTNIRMEIVYKHDNDDDLLEVLVYFWFIKVYTYSAPVIKIDKDSAAIVVKENHSIGPEKIKKRQVITPSKFMKYIKRIKNIIQNVVGLHKIAKTFLSHVKVRKLEWFSSVGIGDAAHTAQLVGWVWTVQWGVVGLVNSYLNMNDKPTMKVQPRFNEWTSQITFSCIISFRIGHAIIAGLMLMKHWKRRPKLYEFGLKN